MRIHKVTALPTAPEPNAFYYVQSGNKAEAYLTSRTGVPHRVSNTDAVKEVVEARVATIPAGPKGDKGDTGAQGIPGLQGLQGPKGDRGDQGLQGLAGPKGETGSSVRIIGSLASKANLPATATVGDGYIIPSPTTGLGELHVWTAETQGWVNVGVVQGPKGDQGAQGIQGLTGPKGDQGLTGQQGLQGIQGPKGDTGAQGLPGVKGDTGAQGLQGIPGPKGDQGDQGLVGPKGDPGLTEAIPLTRAQIDTATNLIPFRVYAITDEENRLAIATSNNSYATTEMQLKPATLAWSPPLFATQGQPYSYSASIRGGKGPFINVRLLDSAGAPISVPGLTLTQDGRMITHAGTPT